MATKEQVKAAATDALVELFETRVSSWREGDKSGEFINVKDASQALVNLERADKIADDVADDNQGNPCGVGFVL